MGVVFLHGLIHKNEKILRNSDDVPFIDFL